jgi:hypothetical protein
MNEGRPIFAQLISHLPERKFRRLVQKYAGNRRVRTFSCWDQFLCMLFAQLTYRESLRDIEVCLRGFGPKLYHLGIHGSVSRTNLSRANETRDWRIYRDFAQHLITIARKLYAEDEFISNLRSAVYAFDSTNIDLCLSLFPWARLIRVRHGAHKRCLKLHTLLDIRSNIPSFIHISDGKVHDVRALDELTLEPLATYVLDRGYFDFRRLYRINQATAFFVIRSRVGMRFKRLYSQPTNSALGILSDQIIRPTGMGSRRSYPDKLRRIRFYDSVADRQLIFLTNNFELPASTIAMLYKTRWQIELFFKWVKQHLRIKNFYGLSENAVKTQIWIAVTAYTLVAVIKKRLKLYQSLYSILQILSVSLVEKTPIQQVFNHHSNLETPANHPNQLNLQGV